MIRDEQQYSTDYFFFNNNQGSQQTGKLTLLTSIHQDNHDTQNHFLVFQKSIRGETYLSLDPKVLKHSALESGRKTNVRRPVSNIFKTCKIKPNGTCTG